MRPVLLLSILFAVPAHASPGAIDLDALAASAGELGFSPPPADIAVPPPPRPAAFAPVAASAAAFSRVSLAGLLDRHWTAVDWFDDVSGRTYAAGTLDVDGSAWLVVSPPGRAPLLVKVERGMSASWTAGGRRYSLDLDVSIFRPRLNNLFEIKDADSGATLWRSRIGDLFRKTDAAGLAVSIAGRPYRLFLSRLPDASARPAAPSDRIGVCLVYDGADASSDGFESYRFLLSDLESTPRSVRLHGGDRAILSVSSDGGELTVSD
ncbi:MAG: hypothetical protein HKL90_11175 [Elusimicrobia bacterium]|nr:hypothetical protein [Elusimicrobiota bacterium]